MLLLYMVRFEIVGLTVSIMTFADADFCVTVKFVASKIICCNVELDYMVRFASFLKQ